MQFGQLADARTALTDGLKAAEDAGANQKIFVFEEMLRSLESAKRTERRANANRPEPVAAPDDIAAALRDLLLEVSGAAA